VTFFWSQFTMENEDYLQCISGGGLQHAYNNRVRVGWNVYTPQGEYMQK